MVNIYVPLRPENERALLVFGAWRAVLYVND
jgi:hypothetical protein